MAAESFGPPAGAKLTLVDEQAPFGPPVGAKLKLVEDASFAPPPGAVLLEVPGEPVPVVDEGPGFLASTANALARGLSSGLPFVGTDARMKDALRLVKAGTQKEFDDETAGPYLSTQDDLRAAGKLTGDTAADDRAVRNDLLARGLHDLTAAESSRAFAEEMYPRSKAEQRKFSETEGVVDVAQLAGRKAVSVTVEGAVPLAKVLAVGAATKNPYLAAGAMGGMMGADTYEGSKLGMLREEAAKRGVADVDGWRALLADEAAMQDIEKRALIRGGVAGVVGAALPATGKLAAGGERLVAGVAPGVVRGVGAQAAGLVTGAGAQGALGAGGEAVSQFATEGTITNPEAIWEAGAVNAAQELGFHAVGGMGDGVAEAKARARAAELRAPLVSLRGADAPLAPYAPSVMPLTLKRRGVPKAEVAPAPSSVPAEGAPVVEAPVVEAPVPVAKAGGDARAPAAGETPARFPENDAQLEQFAQAEADRRITALDTDMGSAEARRLKPKDAPFLSADQWKDTLGWKAVDGKTGEVDWPRVNDAALGKAVEVPELEAAAMKEIVRRELAKDFADAHAQSANGMDLATLLDAGDIKLPTKGQGGDVSSDLIDARSDKAQQGRINQWGGRGISLTDTQGMLEDHGFRHLDSADKIIQAIKDVVDGKPVLPTERPRVLALGAGKGGRGGRGADFGEAAPGTPGGRRSATEGEVYAPEQYVPPLKPTAEQVKAAEAKDTRPFGERVKAAVKDKRNDLVGFMKSKFTVRSDTPAEAWEMLEATKGKMNVVRRAVREAEADLRAAVVESRMEKGGKELTEPEVEAINLALRGDEAALATLSPAVQGRLRVMRETVDGMSDYLRENDVVPEGVRASLEGNRGVYLNRSYRHFSGENMGAAKNRNPAVIEAVKKLFYEGLPEGDAGTAAEAQAFVENLLHRNEEALGSVKVGRRNVDILTKRGDIHPAVRALWGEVTDPFTNYANTVIKMSQLIETHKLQLAIEKAGAGKFLFDRPVGKDFVQIGGAERTAFDELAKRRGEAAEVDPHAEPGDLPAMTDAERMRALGPLAKWYARPEVAEALRHLNGKPPKAQNDFVKWLARANAAGTIAQTVLSYSAQAHQVVQNAAAMAANGIFPGSKASEAFKVIKDAMGRDTPALRAKMREYEALDLLHAGTNEGLLKDIYKRAHGDGDVLDRLVLEPGKKAVGKAAGVYGLQDTVFKVMTYESELGWLKKAYPEQAEAEAKLSPEEQVAPGTLKWQAAEIAKDTMATMDRAVPFVKDWRTNPVLGNFVAWPAEHMRIRANSWKRAVAEVRSENPVIKQRGAMRMAGLVASLTALLGLEEAGRINLKWSKEKAAAMRELMPEYMRGVPVYWLGESDGKVRVLSQEYLNPDAMYSKPFIGAFRQHLEGGPSRDGAAGLLGGVAEVFKPFFSEKMLNARVMDVARNKDGQSGRPVYNETDSPFEIVSKMAVHLGQPVVPGTVNPIVRNIKAQRGTVDMSGRSYNKWDELIGGVTGQRVTEIDLGQALQWRFREFGQRESAAREPLDMVERGASKGGTDATADALVKAWAETETRRFKEYAAMRRVYLAGLRVADKLATVKAMKDAGMGVREIGAIARGVFMPAAPAFRDAKGSAWANSPDGGQPGMREIMSRMVRVQNASLDEAAPDFGATK